MSTIRDIYEKYGDAIFRWALLFLLDNGQRHLTEESVLSEKEAILKKEESADKGTPFMTEDFQGDVVDAAYALSKCSMPDLMGFVQRNIYFEDKNDDPRKKLLDQAIKHYNDDIIEYGGKYYQPAYHSTQQALNRYYPQMRIDVKEDPDAWSEEELRLAAE